MAELKAWVWDGSLKKLSLSSALRIWRDAMLGKTTESVESVYGAVAWLYRATQLRANALARLPYELLQGTDPVESKTFGLDVDWQWLIYRSVAAQCLHGASYWLKRTNAVGILKDLQWLNYQTMTVEGEPEKGITRFRQELGKAPIFYKPEEIVYLPLWNPSDDIGPGIAPAQVALKAAGLSMNANEFIARFFNQGAMPAFILTTEGQVPKAEEARIRTWAKRVFGGVKKAWKPVVLGGGLKIDRLTAPIKELVIPELQNEVRRQIATAFGIPQTLMEDVANRATARVHRVSFYTETVFPHAEMLESRMNRQLWGQLGLRWRFKTEEVEAVQQDEAEKAKSYALLVDMNIIDTNEAREGLGWEPREEVLAPIGERHEYTSQLLDRQAMVGDLRKWRRVALKAAKAGEDPSEREFHSNNIPAELYYDLIARLGGMGEIGVRALFDQTLEEHKKKLMLSRPSQIAVPRRG